MAAAADPAIPVVVAVDGGVELVVRPQRLQEQPAGRPLHGLEVVDREHRLAGRGGEGARVPGFIREDEPVTAPDLLVVVGASTDDVRDVLANRVVVALESLPVDGDPVAEGRAGESGDDRDLREEVVGDGFELAVGGVHGADRVLDRDELLAGGLDVDLGAPERRQDEGLRTDDDVRAVEFRRHLHRHLGRAERRLCRVRVGDRGNEVAPHGQEEADAPVAHPLDGLHHVDAVLAGRVEAELLLDGVEERGRHLLPDAHRAVALDVAVPADGRGSRAGPADVPAQQEEVDDLLDRRDALLLLRDPHGPGDDHALGADVPFGELIDLVGLEPGRLEHLVVVDPGEVGGQIVEAFAVGIDELAVEHRAGVRRLGFEHPLRHGLQQGHVPSEPHLQVLVGELRAPSDDTLRPLRVLVPLQARLDHRVHRDDAGAVPLRVLERGEHARVVRARVLPHHDDEVGLGEVVVGHSGLADADRLAHSPPG